ncbi:MAG: gamma-glutamyl-gamma-aminobutyrate hydrolase family protein [Actinomycetota bacterium]
MKPLLLIKNDPVETFGVAVRALEGAGAPVHVLDAADPAAPRPALDDLSGLVMLGGTMNVDEVDEHPFLKENRDLTRDAIARGVPYLGICLGAQMLARALDAPVRPAGVKEVGFEPVRPLPAAVSDPLLSVWSDGDMVFQWHQDTMDLPPGAVALATGDRIPLQAYRVGNVAWATQFHFEIDADELELWLDEASQFMDLREVWGKSPADIRAEASLHMEAHEEKGSAMFARFAEIAAGLAG